MCWYFFWVLPTPDRVGWGFCIFFFWGGGPVLAQTAKLEHKITLRCGFNCENPRRRVSFRRAFHYCCVNFEQRPQGGQKGAKGAFGGASVVTKLTFKEKKHPIKLKPCFSILHFSGRRRAAGACVTNVQNRALFELF